MPIQPPTDRAFFRETKENTIVFFPWGLTHRGYQLTGKSERKRASRAVSLLVSSIIAIGSWTAYALQPLLGPGSSGATEVLGQLFPPAAALIFAVFGYWLWASRFVEGLPASDLVVSRQERLREAAGLASPRKISLIGALLCCLGVLLIWLQPRAWWLGVLGVALGAGAMFWGRFLKRAAADSSV